MTTKKTATAMVAQKHPSKSASLIIAIGAMLTGAKTLFSTTTLIDLMIFAQAAQFGVLLAMMVLGGQQ